MSPLWKPLLVFIAVISLVSCSPTAIAPTSTTASTAPLPDQHFVAALPAQANYPVLEAMSDDCPVIDGSTSTEPLRTLIVCRMFAVACGWGNGLIERIIVPASLAKDGQMLNFVLKDRVPNSGTHTAYVALLESRADLILVARPPSADEMSAARAQNTDFEVRPVAKDAFVFLANITNPVTSLTIDQARAIYQGKISNWKELGGRDEPITAYQRDNNSGSQELMVTLVMKGGPMINALDMAVPTMNGAVSAIHNRSSGIGYSVYYYVVNMFPDYNVKFLSVNGVQPTPETIANGSYPLTTEIYAVTQTKYRNNSAIKLRDWLFTDEGQTVIKESGYVLSTDK